MSELTKMEPDLMQPVNEIHKGDFREYERRKRVLYGLNLEPLQYEAAHTELVRMMEI